MDFMAPTRFIHIDNVKMLLCFLLILMYVGMLIKALKNVHLALGLIAKNARDIPFAQEDPALGHIQDTGTKMITAM